MKAEEAALRAEISAQAALVKRLELASRRILFTACSEHAGGAWAAQQARHLAAE